MNSSQTALKQRLTPILEHFHAAIETAWKTYFTVSIRTEIPIEAFLVLSINALRGMAVQSIVQDDQAYYKKLRSQWVKIISPLIIVKEDGRALS